MQTDDRSEKDARIDELTLRWGEYMDDGDYAGASEVAEEREALHEELYGEPFTPQLGEGAERELQALSSAMENAGAFEEYAERSALLARYAEDFSDTDSATVMRAVGDLTRDRRYWEVDALLEYLVAREESEGVKGVALASILRLRAEALRNLALEATSELKDIPESTDIKLFMGMKLVGYCHKGEELLRRADAIDGKGHDWYLSPYAGPAPQPQSDSKTGGRGYVGAAVGLALAVLLVHAATGGFQEPLTFGIFLGAIPVLLLGGVLMAGFAPRTTSRIAFVMMFAFPVAGLVARTNGQPEFTIPCFVLGVVFLLVGAATNPRSARRRRSSGEGAAS